MPLTNTYRYPDSGIKNLVQIAMVAREPVRVQGTTKEKVLEPPSKGITVTPSFWRRYGCYLGCGGCCAAVSLDYLPSEVLRFVEEYPEHTGDLTTRTLTVNGVRRELFQIPQQRSQKRWGKEWCQYLDMGTGACGIHKYNPYSCQVELIKFKRVQERAYLYKGPYGRAWLLAKVIDGVHRPGLGTPNTVLCDFSEFDEAQFLENDIPCLQRLKVWADFFEVPTHLAEIITWMRQMHAENKIGAQRTFGGDHAR